MSSPLPFNPSNPSHNLSLNGQDQVWNDSKEMRRALIPQLPGSLPQKPLNKPMAHGYTSQIVGLMVIGRSSVEPHGSVPPPGPHLSSSTLKDIFTICEQQKSYVTLCCVVWTAWRSFCSDSGRTPPGLGKQGILEWHHWTAISRSVVQLAPTKQVMSN